MIEWTPILVALIAAGLLKYVADFFKWLRSRRAAKTPEAVTSTRIATVDQSLAVVARARDELEADNVRLRRERDEQDARHDADRARWELRDKARREEIEVLERKLRDLLSEVEKLKDRHLFDDIEATRTRVHGAHGGGSQYPGPQGH